MEGRVTPSKPPTDDEKRLKAFHRVVDPLLEELEKGGSLTVKYVKDAKGKLVISSMQKGWTPRDEDAA